jgi:hypothetical protein
MAVTLEVIANAWQDAIRRIRDGASLTGDASLLDFHLIGIYSCTYVYNGPRSVLFQVVLQNPRFLLTYVDAGAGGNFLRGEFIKGDREDIQMFCGDRLSCDFSLAYPIAADYTPSPMKSSDGVVHRQLDVTGGSPCPDVALRIKETQLSAFQEKTLNNPPRYRNRGWVRRPLSMSSLIIGTSCSSAGSRTHHRGIVPSPTFSLVFCASSSFLRIHRKRFALSVTICGLDETIAEKERMVAIAAFPSKSI